MKLDAILLGLALERLHSPKEPAGRRLVRMAEAALTTLHGASQLAAAAPGFVEPFNVVSACAQLTELELDEQWPTPQIVPQAQATDEPWSPPSAVDRIRGEDARLTGDGVVAILGLHRLAAAEEAVRAAPPGAEITVVLVTGAPAELAPLARLTISDFRECLHQAFPSSAWPGLQVVCDETGALAAAAGVPAVSDATETAVRIEAGRIVARAEGIGACHATASTAPRSLP
jgi:hypothetical protein